MCLKKEHSGKKKYTCMPLLPKSLVTVKLEKCEFWRMGHVHHFSMGTIHNFWRKHKGTRALTQTVIGTEQLCV